MHQSSVRPLYNIKLMDHNLHRSQILDIDGLFCSFPVSGVLPIIYNVIDNKYGNK